MRVPQPRCLFLDLSYACNIQCTTCRCPTIDRDTGGASLSLELANRAIDEFAAMGGESLGLYGGEPLLVKHVYDVVKHGAHAGLQVRLTTNGMPATIDNSRRLIGSGLSGVTVSVDGDKMGHETIRGKGTFDKSMQGARNLLIAARELARHDFTLDLHVTVSRGNVRSFAGLIHHAAQLGGGVSVSVTHFSRLEPPINQLELLFKQSPDPQRNHWNLPRDLLLRRDDVGALIASVAEMKMLAHDRGIPLNIDPALDQALDASGLLEGTFVLRQRCPVFETALIIGPDGAVGSCPMLTHLSFGLLSDQSLLEIWTGRLFSDARQVLRAGYLPVCSACCNHADLM